MGQEGEDWPLRKPFEVTLKIKFHICAPSPQANKLLFVYENITLNIVGKKKEDREREL